MAKYIEADRLRAEIKFAKSVYDNPKRVVHGVADAYRQDGRAAMCDDILKKIDSLQQDETQVDRMLCSQVWWEEQGWIMIPPDATIEGIDSLLRQVRKKLQQESTPDTDALHTELINLLKKYRIGEETAITMADSISDTYGAQRYMDGFCDGLDKEDTKQPNDVCAEIKEYYGEDLAFEDERTKAAYHFFSAGKSFALRQYAEEREKHITDLLNNFKKGMNAGYEKAKSELKDRKIECNPTIKEFIEKFISIGAANLDEAAEEYVKDYGYTEDDYKRERIIAEEHFKSGAEWMAGQGITFKGKA